MNAEELSKYIDEILKNSYIEYNYVVNREKCLDYITTKILHNIKDMNNINSMIEENLKDYLKIEIQSKNNLFNIINNIIENKENNSNILETISSYLSDIDYIIDPDNIIELIKENKKLNSYLKELVEKNKKEITEGRIRDIQNDETIISFIEVYCELNNIDITLQENLISTITSDINYDYLREIGKIKLLTQKEERELIRRINQKDEQARIKMIEANLKLVVFVAKQYKNYNLPFEDIIQEGNIGLMKAIEKYDIDKGFKFSTYATWWIRSYITRALEEKTRIIKITPYINHQLTKYIKAKSKLSDQIEREPSYKELAEYMGISEEKIKIFERIVQEPVSINKKVRQDAHNGEKESELINFISSEDEELTEKVYIRDMQKRLKEILKSNILNDKEKKVLILIYGIGTEPRTFAEVGAILNTSRQRIKQIEKKALHKLSMDKDVKKLANAFNDSIKITEDLISTNKDKNINKKEQITQDRTKEILEEVIEPVHDTSKINIVTDEDYLNLLYLIRSPIFNQLYEDLSMKEMVVTFLNTGLLEGKKFTEEAISTYFNIEKEEINKIINKTMTNHAEKIERIERYFNNSFTKKLTK